MTCKCSGGSSCPVCILEARVCVRPVVNSDPVRCRALGHSSTGGGGRPRSSPSGTAFPHRTVATPFGRVSCSRGPAPRHFVVGSRRTSRRPRRSAAGGAEIAALPRRRSRGCSALPETGGPLGVCGGVVAWARRDDLLVVRVGGVSQERFDSLRARLAEVSDL